MRSLLAIALLAASAAAAAPALATDWSLPPDAITCTGGAEAATDDCVAKAYEKADAELNAVWKKVLAGLDKNAADAGLTAGQAADWKADLLAAQQAWVTFKDKDCNGARSYEYWGGSARSLAVNSCQWGYTVTRTEDLKARYLDN